MQERFRRLGLAGVAVLVLLGGAVAFGGGTGAVALGCRSVDLTSATSGCSQGVGPGSVGDASASSLVFLAGHTGVRSPSANTSDPGGLRVSLTVTPNPVALGGTVNYTANATGGSPPYTSYIWGQPGNPMPPGCTSPPTTGPYLVCPPSSAGTYSSVVTVVDSNGNSATSDPVSLIVNGPLSAKPAVSPNPIDQGQATTFAANASGGTPPYSYSWAGLPPGCPTSGGANVYCASVTASGSFTVTVTVNDSSGGSTQASATLTVNPPLAVTVTITPPSVSVGQTAWVNASATGGSGSYATYSYSGLPPGCASANAGAVQCTPSGAGSFSITATVHDSIGGSATSSPVTMTVSAGLAVGVSSAHNATDVGRPVTLNATVSGGSGPYSYAWSGLPPGCSAGSVPSVTCTPSSTGSFAVTVAVTDSAGHQATSPAFSLVVNTAPSVTAVRATPANGSSPVNVTFSVTVAGGSAPLTYSWVFGDGAHVSTASPTVVHRYVYGGNFTPTVWANDSAGASASGHTSVRVIGPIPFGLTLSGTYTFCRPTAGCAMDLGQTTVLSAPAHGTASGPYTYSWTGLPSGCPATNTSNVTCTPASTGSSTVHVTVTSASHASANATMILTVNPALAISSVVRHDCSVSPYALLGNATAKGGTPPYRFFWNFGARTNDSNVSGANASYTYTYASPFHVRAYVTDATNATVNQTHYVTAPYSGCGGTNTTTGGVPLLPLAIGLVAVAAIAIGVGAAWLSRQRRRGGGAAALGTPVRPTGVRPLTPAYVPPPGGPPAAPPPSASPMGPPAGDAGPPVYDPDVPL
jgi:hypothetical protein